MSWFKGQMSAQEGRNLPGMEDSSLQVITTLKVVGLPGKNVGKGQTVLYDEVYRYLSRTNNRTLTWVFPGRVNAADISQIIPSLWNLIWAPFPLTSSGAASSQEKGVMILEWKWPSISKEYHRWFVYNSYTNQGILPDGWAHLNR